MGSEMCIRDSRHPFDRQFPCPDQSSHSGVLAVVRLASTVHHRLFPAMIDPCVGAVVGMENSTRHALRKPERHAGLNSQYHSSNERDGTEPSASTSPMKLVVFASIAHGVNQSFASCHSFHPSITRRCKAALPSALVTKHRPVNGQHYPTSSQSVQHRVCSTLIIWPPWCSNQY